MKQFNYTIQDALGIHAIPAELLVNVAEAYKDTVIKISNGTKEADFKRIMAVMAMGIKHGQQVTVTCEGRDEDGALAAMETFFKENL